MNENFWVAIKKSGSFYTVERWEAGEDRILFVEKKKCLTAWGSRKYARKIVSNYIANQYIKEK